MSELMEKSLDQSQEKRDSYLPTVDVSKVTVGSKAPNKGTVLSKGADGNFIFNATTQKGLIDKDFSEAHAKSRNPKEDIAFDKKRLIKKVGSSGDDFNKDSINKLAKWQESVGLNPTARYDRYTRKTDFVLEVAESAERVGANNAVLSAGQGVLESGYKFKNSYNQGGIKANSDDIKKGNYTLDWTTEDYSDSSKLKAKQSSADADPRRSETKMNPGHKWYMDSTVKNKIHVQEYFKKFETLDAFTTKHDSVVINILRNKIANDKKSKFYEPDPKKVEAKIQEVLKDPKTTVSCLQSGSEKGRYATDKNGNTPYVDKVMGCVKEAETIIARAKKAGYKGNASDNSTKKPSSNSTVEKPPVVEAIEKEVEKKNPEVQKENPVKNSIPVYYPKGATDTLARIQWNKGRNYTQDYIRAFQKEIEVEPDADIGTNTVNAIRHYQETKSGFTSKDGKWGEECEKVSGLKREYNKAPEPSTKKTSKTEKSNSSKTPYVCNKPGYSHNGSEYSEKGNNVIQYARQYLSLPYVWAGKGQVLNKASVAKLIANNGNDKSKKHGTWDKYYKTLLPKWEGKRAFDCSGICVCAYKETGTYIGQWQPSKQGVSSLEPTHTVAHFNGKPKLSEMKIGDVLRTSGHYVMYSGNGKVLEAKEPVLTEERDFNSISGVLETFRYFDD